MPDECNSRDPGSQSNTSHMSPYGTWSNIPSKMGCGGHITDVSKTDMLAESADDGTYVATGVAKLC